MNSRARRFAFTQYDLEFEYEKLGNVNYLIVGLETCPSTGRKHHQGYVEFNSQRTKQSVIKKLNKCHVEIAKGNSKENIKYCKKEGHIVLETGEPTAQGKRMDLEAIVNEIQENPDISTKELIDINPGAFCRNYRALEIVKDQYEPKRDWVPEVHYIWGPSGSGKTRTALEAGATKVWFKDGFFSGYEGQDTVLLDDVDEWTFFRNRNVLLELLDRYAYRINVKGGSRNWKPRTIYITSNFPASVTFCFGHSGVCDPAIKRRITFLTHLNDSQVGDG